jgi:CheY-like chemotaxis protein
MANILLVDDNEADRLLLKTALETKGHTLFNGLRLIRELREQDPDTAIAAISGAAAGQLPLAEDLGAIQALAKPIDPQKLLTAVAEALDARERDLWERGKRP